LRLEVPYFKQEKSTTCGPACIRMVLEYNGIRLSEKELEDIFETSWLGNTCEELASGVEKLGFLSEVVENFTVESLCFSLPGKIFIERGNDMEIYEKVKRYLYENIGHLTAPGTPRFDLKAEIWRVPVLCKTERGILIVGEFTLDKKGEFINIPTKQEMLKTVEIEISKLPFLVYGDRKDLEAKDIKPVTI